MESLRHRLHFLGMVSKAGKPLVKGVVHGILTNPVYIGLIPHKGELYEGKFQPIVRKEVWDRVQQELKRRSRPRKAKDGHNFPFTGLFECGECGCMITAQYAKGRKYIYYHCSKKHGKCNQAYINSTAMVSQLKEELEIISLPEDWAEIILAEIEAMERREVREQRSFFQNLERQIQELDKKIDKLINSFLDGLIEKEIYLNKKDELLKMKVDLQERQKDFGKKGVAWVEPAREWVDLAHHAGKLALSDDYFEIKQLIKKIGSNHHVMDKKVQLDVVPPFSLVAAYRRGRWSSADGAVCGGCNLPAGRQGKKDNLPNQQVVLSCRDGEIYVKKARPNITVWLHFNFSVHLFYSKITFPTFTVPPSFTFTKYIPFE